MIGKIGILAGGVAELAMLKQLQKTYPMLNFVYWGDSVRYPLSAKSEEALMDSLQDGLDFMQAEGVESVFLASPDLALAWILAFEAELEDEASEDYSLLEILFEPVGDDYEFAVLNPLPSFAAGLWRASDPDGRGAKNIGILAGETFINAAILPEIILALNNADCAIHAKDSGLLAALIDNNWQRRPETNAIVKKHIKPLKDQHVDVIAVADPALDILAGLIDDKSGKRAVVEYYSTAVLDTAEAFIEAHKLPNSKGSAEITLTDYTEKTLMLAKKYYGSQIKPL